MSKNIHGLSDLANEAIVKLIRREFLSEVEANPQLYDAIDIERCRSEDWQIERFYIEKGSSEDALKALIKAMKWKKSYGIHERNHQYFPKEIYLIFETQVTRDKEGTIHLWGTSRNYTNIPEFNELFKQFNAFSFERIDREAGNRAIVNISDMKGTGFSNWDLTGLTKFSVELLEYYPCNSKMNIAVDPPLLFESFLKLTKAILPQSMAIKIVTVKVRELTNYVNLTADEIPISFGGNRQNSYQSIEGMKTLYELKHFGFNDKQIKKFYKSFNLNKK